MKLAFPQTLTVVFIALLTICGVRWILSRAADTETLGAELKTCGIAEDLQQQLRSSNKLIVVVVGDGVKDKTLAKTRPYSSNYAQGWDLYEGVAHAAKKPAFQAISELVDIVYVDDGGESRCAELISEEIIRAPRVLADTRTGTFLPSCRSIQSAAPWRPCLQR